MREDSLFAVLLPFAFVAVFGAVLIVPRMLEFRRLNRVGEVVRGKVIETYPTNHNTCKYRFVAGRSFDGTGTGCGSASIGEAITVHFDPGDPSHSTNVDPDRGFVNDLVPFVLALVGFPLIAALGVHLRRR
jgi:uncharacterized protein DUF3592